MNFFLDISIFCVLIYHQSNIWNRFSSPVLGHRLEEREILKMSYLICDKRKGSPKIHIEVCRRKCKLVQECKTYKEFINSLEKKAA